MKIISAILAILVFALSFTLPVLASSPELPVPEISGESALLIDIATGETLFSKNPDTVLEPASTTKIMTALLALENGRLDDVVTAGPSMLNWDLVQGTRIYLEPGEQLTLRSLLYALLLNSANDAAVAIAEYISGDVSRFAALMNQRAEQIGAVNTNFKNPSGLSEDGHVTTARDLAQIARTAYQNPVFRDIVRTRKHVIPRAKEGIPTEMYNVNELLWTNPSVTGIKTGYTSSAGNTYVASASQDGRELIGVILKSPGGIIYDDMEKLFDYGFANFENKILKPEGTVLSTVMVNNTPVDLVLEEDIIFTQEIGSTNPPNLELNVLPAPTELTKVYEGQVITTVQVLSGEKVVDILPLMAGSTVYPASSSWLAKSLWALGLGALLYLSYKRYRTISYRRRRRKRLNRQMQTKKMPL